MLAIAVAPECIERPSGCDAGLPDDGLSRSARDIVPDPGAQRLQDGSPHDLLVALLLLAHELRATFYAIVVLGVVLFRDRPATDLQVDMRFCCH